MPIEQVYAAVPPAVARIGGAVSPIGLPLTGEDHLRVFMCNVVAGNGVTLDLRTLIPRGSNVIANRYEAAATTSPFGSFEYFPLSDGVLLNLVVRAQAANVGRGQCFVSVDLVRGRSARQLVATLLSGYVGSWGGLAWPGTPLQSPLDGPGYVYVVSGVNPAQLAPAIINLPFAVRWRVLAMTVVLTTDATAGTRWVYFEALQSLARAVLSQSSAQPGPSSVSAHSFGAGMAPVAVATFATGIGSLPVPLLLETGTVSNTSLRCHMLSPGVLDAFTNVLALVEEWRNPPSQLGE